MKNPPIAKIILTVALSALLGRTAQGSTVSISGNGFVRTSSSDVIGGGVFVPGSTYEFEIVYEDEFSGIPRAPNSTQTAYDDLIQSISIDGNQITIAPVTNSILISQSSFNLGSSVDFVIPVILPGMITTSFSLTSFFLSNFDVSLTPLDIGETIESGFVSSGSFPSTLSIPSSIGSATGTISSVSFNAVPEPSVGMLGLLGACFVVLRRNRID